MPAASRRFLLFAAVLALRPGFAPAPTRAADLDDLVAPPARPQKIVGDCKFTEGPAFGPQGFLLFSDIPNNRIMQVLPDGSSHEFLKPSGQANGLMFDAAGRLYLCQGGDRQIAVMPDLKTKELVVLADRFDGKKLNSPNDLALDAHGGLYFTDPRYGGDEPPEQPVMGVYYIDKAGALTQVISTLQRPNGILVSADGKSLFVAEPNRRQLYRYPVEAPGVLGKGELLFTGDEKIDGGGPDGMALDERGNLYLTYNAVVVITPQGKLLGRIEVPEHPANCKFGGLKNKTLYMTARTSLYALDMQVAGTALQPAGPPGKGPPAAAANGAVKTTPVKAGDLTLNIPAGWKPLEVRPGFRAAQFTIPAADGDKTGGELVVYYFGKGGAGGVGPNVKRWIGQFEAAERKVRVLEGKSNLGDYTFVDLTGAYNKPIGPPVEMKSERMPGWRVLVSVVQTANGPYFLKFDAPAKTAAANEAAFRAAFGGNAKTEKPAELKADSE